MTRLQSMLDWYFDCEGSACSLKKWLTSSHVAAAAPAEKLHRYNNAKTATLYTSFHVFLKLFREKVRSFDAQYGELLKRQGTEDHIWLRDDYFALDLHNAKQGESAQVWLGLGRLEDGFRKPVAIKRNVHKKDPSAEEESFLESQARLKRVMRKLKPGSFIASAELVPIEPLDWPPVSLPKVRVLRASAIVLHWALVN
jgi:hypothetical protein